MIAWLTSHWGKLYNLLVYYYDRIINAARYAYSWAISKASAARYAAIGWARNQIDQAKATLNTAISAARSFASSLYLAALRAISSAAAELRQRISSVWDQARQFVIDQWDRLKAIVGLWIESALTTAKGLIETAKQSIWKTLGKIAVFINDNLAALNAMLDWFRVWKPKEDQQNNHLAPISEPSIVDKLKQLTGEVYTVITGFFDDPVAYMAAWLQTFLLDFLAYQVAASLGAVQTELPPPPKWSLKGAPKVSYPGEPLPPGAAGLTPPLAHLAISGNTFSIKHPGLDLGLTTGAPVHAMHAGRATVPAYMATGYGNYVIIDGPPWWTLYGHLQKASIRSGDTVYAGQVVGLGNSTGLSTGPHLHLEIKYNNKYTDPASVLGLGG